MNEMMKKHMMKLFLCMLLCAVMAVPMAGPALAFADSGGDAASGITIRITPPSGWAVQRAEVEVRITDNTGAGFQTAQVKAGSGRWRDVTGELERTENRCYCVVEITENCTVYVRVTGLDSMIYEKSQYIRCFNTVSDDQGNSTPVASDGSVKPKVPAGQGTVVDNATGEDGREFFTIATQDDNTFYLVIDRQQDNENVYFLDTVKESDLLSLAEKDKGQEGSGVSAIPDPKPVCNCTDKCAPGVVNTDCPVCALTMKDCIGKAPAAGPDGDKDPELEKKGNSSTMLLVAIAVLAVGSAGYYLKIWKPKHDLDDAEDFDALTSDEETVNEDDLEPTVRRVLPDEPEEPDYPEGYGYEEPEVDE